VGAGRGRLRKIGVRSDDRDRLELLGLGDLKETAREFVDRGARRGTSRNIVEGLIGGAPYRLVRLTQDLLVSSKAATANAGQTHIVVVVRRTLSVRRCVENPDVPSKQENVNENPSCLRRCRRCHRCTSFCSAALQSADQGMVVQSAPLCGETLRALVSELRQWQHEPGP